MLETDWSVTWRGAFGAELRAEAMGLAGHGWPVMPGTSPTEHGAAETGQRPVPLYDDWRDRAGKDHHDIAAWWPAGARGLLVATGGVLDAVEVDDTLGRRAAGLLRAGGQPAPIVAMPNGRWLFLTRTSERLPIELAVRDSVRWHGQGSWVPMPPTPMGQGVVHWRVKPECWGWRLPQADVVHDVLVRALNLGHPEPEATLLPAERSAA